MDSTAYPTIGSIAKRYDTSVSRIRYVIATRGIRPSGWAGSSRVFSDLEVERIGRELKAISAGREPAHARHTS